MNFIVVNSSRLEWLVQIFSKLSFSHKWLLKILYFKLFLFLFFLFKLVDNNYNKLDNKTNNIVK
jgi:hypothetical protein